MNGDSLEASEAIVLETPIFCPPGSLLHLCQIQEGNPITQSSTKILGKFSLCLPGQDWTGRKGRPTCLGLPASAHCPGSLYGLFFNSFQPATFCLWLSWMDP